MRTISNANNIISINDLRRKFGDIENALPYVDHFVLTKNGAPFAILSATPEVKKNMMKQLAGSFKNTSLESDKLWEDVLKRKSRKKRITL